MNNLIDKLFIQEIAKELKQQIAEEEDRPQEKHEEGSFKGIVVAPHGWVLVGNVVRNTNGTVHVFQGSVIRRWGTTEGLPQLAREGPQEETVLEGPADFLSVQSIFILPTERAKW